MKKEIIKTNKAPEAIGPYSQAVKAGSFIFISGQIPINPETGELVTGSIEKETRQAITNLGEILTASGSSYDQVVKTTIYLTDMNDFSTVNEIFAEFFQNQKPARACIEASKLPKGVNFEIEAIAITDW